METLFFFFFQAEDGIRDSSVTGVQTCALPISLIAPQYGRPVVCVPFPIEPCVKTFPARADQGAQRQTMMVFQCTEYRHDFVWLEFVGLHHEVFAFVHIVVATGSRARFECALTNKAAKDRGFL